jgi:hypothetical protein
MRGIVALTFLMVLLSGACLAGEWQAFTPIEDTNAVLHNPDMGWVVSCGALGCGENGIRAFVIPRWGQNMPACAGCWIFGAPRFRTER